MWCLAACNLMLKSVSVLMYLQPMILVIYMGKKNITMIWANNHPSLMFGTVKLILAKRSNNLSRCLSTPPIQILNVFFMTYPLRIQTIFNSQLLPLVYSSTSKLLNSSSTFVSRLCGPSVIYWLMSTWKGGAIILS